MALDFTSDMPVADAGLSIRFDMKGLDALLEALQGAIDKRTFTIGGGTLPAAFGTVTFICTEGRDDRPRARTPTPPLVLEPAD